MPLTLTSRILLGLLGRSLPGGRMPDDLAALRRMTGRPMLPLSVARRRLRSVEQRTIPGPAGELAVRIYRPRAEPVGAVLFLHGGGFVHCGLDSHDGMACALAHHSCCTLVSVDYRLAPEHRFPAAVEDCAAALAWVGEHAAELGTDPGRIAVAGDSAGGNLAAVVSQVARDRGGRTPAFQLLLYPTTHGRRDVPSRQIYGRGYFLTTALMQWYLDQYIDTPEHYESAYFAPILGRLHDLPPACIVTAEYDPLRDEGAHYAEALREAGVAVEYACYRGMIHGFLSFGWLQPAARRALRQGGRAIRAALSEGDHVRKAVSNPA